MWQHLAQWSVSEFIKYMWPHNMAHNSTTLVSFSLANLGSSFFNFLNKQKGNYSFISPLKEQGMDAYLVSPAASPRGKIRLLFGRCQFHNMTNLHLQFWSQLPSKLLDPTCCTAYLQSLCFNEAFWLQNKLAYSIKFHYYTSKYAKSSSKDETWEKHLPS
jgi:hypothetical protein